jgi:hypothetical protein
LKVSWGRAIWLGFNTVNMTMTRYDEMEYNVTFAALRSSAQDGCCWCALLLENILENTKTSGSALAYRIWLHFSALPKRFWPPRIDLLSVNISGEDEEHLCEIVPGAFTKSRKLSP